MVVATALLGALARGAQACADLGEEARRASGGLVDVERLADLFQAFEGVAKAIDSAVREVEAQQEAAGRRQELDDPREVPVVDGPSLIEVDEEVGVDGHCGAVTSVGGPFGLVAWYSGTGPSTWVVEAITRRGDAGSAMYWITAPDSWKPIDLDGQPWVVVRFSQQAASMVEVGAVLLPATTRGLVLLELIEEVLEGSDEDSVARARADFGLERSSASSSSRTELERGGSV